MAEVLRRRRHASGAWSAAQRAASKAAAGAAAAEMRHIARARRPASEGAALAQWKWLAMLRTWRLRLEGSAGYQERGQRGVASAESPFEMASAHPGGALEGAGGGSGGGAGGGAHAGGRDATDSMPTVATQGHGGSARGGRRGWSDGGASGASGGRAAGVPVWWWSAQTGGAQRRGGASRASRRQAREVGFGGAPRGAPSARARQRAGGAREVEWRGCHGAVVGGLVGRSDVAHPRLAEGGPGDGG